MTTEISREPATLNIDEIPKAISNQDSQLTMMSDDEIQDVSSQISDIIVSPSIDIAQMNLESPLENQLEQLASIALDADPLALGGTNFTRVAIEENADKPKFAQDQEEQVASWTSTYWGKPIHDVLSIFCLSAPDKEDS